MLRQDAGAWIKTGVEYTDGVMHFSVVVTGPRSDWSVIPLPEATPDDRGGGAADPARRRGHGCSMRWTGGRGGWRGSRPSPTGRRGRGSWPARRSGPGSGRGSRGWRSGRRSRGSCTTEPAELRDEAVGSGRQSMRARRSSRSTNWCLSAAAACRARTRARPTAAEVWTRWKAASSRSVPGDEGIGERRGGRRRGSASARGPAPARRRRGASRRAASAA